VLLTPEGKEITENEVEGLLAMKFPWPSIMRTTWGDHERCRQTYFSSYKGYYFTGDGAKRDADGRYRIIGRVDDVINVSGHRFGTAEIENAINEAKGVVESAVVGYPHDIKGQGIYAYVVAKRPSPPTMPMENMRGEILEPWWPDRPHRQAGQDPVRERPAEDAQRQDHAAHPAEGGGE
jgi:acetyl-CoA synthetase